MSVIPESVVQGWKDQYNPDSALSKKYPDMAEEIERVSKLLELDRKAVHGFCFEGVFKPQERDPVYIATAGPPLAGKSTTLEQQIEANPELYGNTVKVDPDRWAMVLMPSYQGYMMSASQVAKALNYQKAQKRAYDICRPASNVIALEILNEAADKGYDIAHGTTMTGKHSGNLLKNLKEKGYQIHLLLCNAEDDIRAEAAEYRQTVQGYYQSTPEDVINKGLLFPQRMQTYFEFGDKITLFWKYGVTENAVEAAIYSQGKIEIIDHAAYDSFINKFERDYLKLDGLMKKGRRVVPKEEIIIPPSFESIEALFLNRQ